MTNASWISSSIRQGQRGRAGRAGRASPRLSPARGAPDPAPRSGAALI